MSYTVPYSFIPGTKARAQEINANFGAVNDNLSSLDSSKANIDLSNITSEGIDVIKNNTTLRNLGELIFSPIPLTDLSLHLLDGSLISKTGIYQDFVNYIASLYGDGTDVPNYFCTESAWQNAVGTYGVCGKFVYDSENNTVRLPKITGILEGTTDASALGDLIEAGLPNITSKSSNFAGLNAWSGDGTQTIGAIKGTESGYSPGSSGLGRFLYLDFDASRSSSIYGNSNTVQPQTIKVFYYIVIATCAKTDFQVDIDEIATDLNGKADVDLSNLNASQNAKNEIISWGMPDYSAGVSKSWETSNYADTSGYIVTRGSGTGASACFVIQISLDNSNWIEISRIYIPTNGGDSGGIFPVEKGCYWKAGGAAGGQTNLTFYPMKGGN